MSSEGEPRTDKADGVEISGQLINRVFAQNFKVTVMFLLFIIVGIGFLGSDHRKIRGVVFFNKDHIPFLMSFVAPATLPHRIRRSSVGDGPMEE